MYQNNYSDLSTSHSYLCMLNTPFSGSTFHYLFKHYPFNSHFLKNKIVKRHWWSCLLTKMKAKSMPTIVLIFFACTFLLYLSSKLKILQTEDSVAVHLHTISIIQMVTEPREVLHSQLRSFQNLQVLSCYYITLKEIIKLWENTPSVPHHPHFHYTDYDQEGDLLIPVTGLYIQQ